MHTLGKYRLVERLASGGMADVWRAEVANAEGVVKTVALKLVRGDHAAQDAFIRMFIQEARLASRLSHANVVQVFEFHQIEGQYVLAMELVRGRHLGQVIERCRELGIRFGLPRALHVCGEVAKALAYAHRLADGSRPLGIVHRDVSPHNVLVSFEGEVKLADFGIARARNLAGLTEPGTLKGKLAYMAPEQARGEDVDARADVFSLGVVLWELLAGRRLFARDSEAATLGAVLGPEPVSPPSAWNEAVPAELDAIVLAALERDPARRTESAQALATALAGVLLRTARAPEEFDLRALMHRLWPDEAAGAQEAPRDATQVRTPSPAAPIAREPEVDGRTAVAPPEGLQGLDGLEDAPTRTAVAAGRRRRKGRVVALGTGGAVVVGLLIGAGVLAGREQVRERDQVRVQVRDQDQEREQDQGAAQGQGKGQGGGRDQDQGRGQDQGQGQGQGSGQGSGKGGGQDQDHGRDQVQGQEAGSGQLQGAETAAVAEPKTDVVPAAAPRPAKPARPVVCVNRFIGVPVPPAESGEGLVSVNVAASWAELFVDGRSAGFTPCTVRLPAGPHRLRAVSETQGAAQVVVDVKAGRRKTWTPRLSR